MRFQGSILAKLVSLSSYEATHMIFSWITSIEQVLVKIEEVTRNRPAGLTNFPPTELSKIKVKTEVIRTFEGHMII